MPPYFRLPTVYHDAAAHPQTSATIGICASICASGQNGDRAAQPRHGCRGGRKHARSARGVAEQRSHHGIRFIHSGDTHSDRHRRRIRRRSPRQDRRRRAGTADTGSSSRGIFENTRMPHVSAAGNNVRQRCLRCATPCWYEATLPMVNKCADARRSGRFPVPQWSFQQCGGLHSVFHRPDHGDTLHGQMHVQRHGRTGG